MMLAVMDKGSIMLDVEQRNKSSAANHLIVVRSIHGEGTQVTVLSASRKSFHYGVWIRIQKQPVPRRLADNAVAAQPA